jgi:hypothetical protein
MGFLLCFSSDFTGVGARHAMTLQCLPCRLEAQPTRIRHFGSLTDAAQKKQHPRQMTGVLRFLQDIPAGKSGLSRADRRPPCHLPLILLHKHYLANGAEVRGFHLDDVHARNH